MNEEKKQELSEILLEEYRKGNVVILNFEGRLMVSKLDDFIGQPADGILYDLNRLPETTLTFVDDGPKWVNDLAVAMVIRKLKEQADLVPDLLEALELAVDSIGYECHRESGWLEKARQAIAGAKGGE